MHYILEKIRMCEQHRTKNISEKIKNLLRNYCCEKTLSCINHKLLEIFSSPIVIIQFVWFKLVSFLSSKFKVLVRLI